MQRAERIQRFVEEIWQWFAIHKRTLPWRDLQIEDPVERGYRILVSEVMLQQTQVPRVIVTYRNFLERFPRLADLAAASNRDVLIAWRGMGYNSRALRLRDAAGVIMKNGKLKMENKEVFPTSMEELRSIPGIGHYTAAAIRNFAFGLPTPCIDTNIRRIFHRTFIGPENADGMWEKGDEYLLEIAGEVLEEAMTKGTTANWHAALMDFGSLVQTKKNPRWDICPLTAKKIMKTNSKNFPVILRSAQEDIKKEPGRLVGSVFIPNRIFRGRIVEALRDAHHGLTREEIGQYISVDWDAAIHRAWLDGIMTKLLSERMVREQKGKFVLG